MRKWIIASSMIGLLFIFIIARAPEKKVKTERRYAKEVIEFAEFAGKPPSLIIKIHAGELITGITADAVIIIWAQNMVIDTPLFYSIVEYRTVEERLERKVIASLKEPLEIWVETKEELEYWRTILSKNEPQIIYPYPPSNK